MTQSQGGVKPHPNETAPRSPLPDEQWSGGYYALEELYRAWVRTSGKTHVARSASCAQAICGAPIMITELGGEVTGKEMCGSCARVWESRMKAIEEDPWESF